MSISFLVPDLGWPIVGIAARMAGYLAGEHDVEIVGPCLWGHPNDMYAREFDYRLVDCPRIYRYPEYWAGVRKLARAVQGDVVFAMKAFGSSLPPALLAKRQRGCRVIAYLDEWDGAIAASWTWRQRWRHLARDWVHPCDNLHVPRIERRLRDCDLRLVTTTFLRERFAGHLFHIGVDTGRFQPQNADAVSQLKKGLGLEGLKLLVFGGVVRPHKGLEVFANALARLHRTDVALLILGPMNAHVQGMMEHPEYGKFIRCPAVDAPTTQAIHADMPLYLGLGDVLAVPLADTLLSQSQMPCKVFEAMAMGKPIIASAVSDLPAVLDGCGRVVDPGRVDRVAEALDDILNHPDAARQLGENARQRCIEHYSASASAYALQGLVREVLTSSPQKQDE